MKFTPRVCKLFTGAAETAVRMMLHHPWMMVMYYSMTVYEDDQIPTLCTNGVSMWINPKFWNQLTRNQKVTAFAHEIGHKMLLHVARMGPRIMPIWNIAGDHVINLMLVESGFEPLSNMTIDGRPWTWFCDDKYKGMTTEHVYEALLQEYKDKEDEEGKGGQGGEGEGDGDGDPAGEGEESSAKVGRGQGRGKGRSSGEIAEDDLGASADVLEFGDLPEGVEDEGQAKGDGETMEEFEQRVCKEVKQAEQMSKIAGNTPAWFSRVVGNAEKSKVKWYEILEEHLTTLHKADYSWHRWSKRGMVMTGTIMPDMYEPAMGGLEVYVDCSGSCWSALDTFNQHFKAMVEQLKPSFVRVKYFQTQVMTSLTHRYERGEVEVELHPGGGGGTSFSWLAKDIEAEEEQPEAVIVLTDLYGDFGHEPEVPVFWVSVSECEQAPFGEVVNV